jgi:predicted SAM-dependent methyltransferase
MKPAMHSVRILHHYGCGPLATKTSWTDFDGSWNLKFAKMPHVIRSIILRLLGHRAAQYSWPAHVRYLNLTKKLGFLDDSVDAVYASHVWEHLYFEEALKLTEECYRILKPGGLLRLAVPNLKYHVETYLNSASEDAALVLNEQLLYRPKSRPASTLMRLYIAMADFHSHKFMYDAPYLMKIMKEAGFTEVTEMECKMSRIEEIAEIESPRRVSDTAGFAVEGIKN